MTNNSPSVSGIVTTFNSAKTLERTLKSLSFVDEIIIIDGGSLDETEAIARKYNTRFIIHAWEGYGAQKNFGMEQARGQWTLFLDADEEITPPLAQEIRRVIVKPRHNVYWLKIIDIFAGYRLSHLHGHNPRLLRKGQAAWNNAPVHEEVVLRSGQHVKLGDAASAVLEQVILHHSYNSVAAYLKKMHKYTTLDAERTAASGLHRSGRPVKPWFGLPFILSTRQFIKLLLYRRGVLDGVGGILWSLLSAYYEWELAWKYMAIIRSNKTVV